jgi:hypothetical protein
MGPSDVHVQTAGVLEGEEMAQAPGGPCVGYRRAASNGADREAGLKATDPASPEPQGVLPRAGGLPARLPKIAEAQGAERRPRWGGQPPRSLVAE